MSGALSHALRRGLPPVRMRVPLVGRFAPCAPSYEVSGRLLRNDDSTVGLALD
jgi:hypothetical protein